jgi:CheY-like chemotaxis protein
VTLACSRAIPRGESVRIDLSFPGLVDEFSLGGCVAFAEPGDGYGLPPRMTFDIVESSAGSRELLGRLVALRSIPPPGIREATYRCLLVEDNPFIRDLFSFAVETYCADRGAKVALDSATTSEDGWAKVEAQRYDLAIIDHYLPAETGAALIARVRGDARYATLPIVAISVGGAAARDASIDAGADLFLDKPLAMRDLFTTLDELTRRRRP